MTTLPQTTPMRLPRPAGAGQIAIPNAPSGVLGSAGAAMQMTGNDVWRVFRSDWWLIVGLVVLMSVAGFFVNGYLANHHPTYTASGLVKVQLPEEIFSDRSEEVSASPQSIEVEQKTQAQGLMQPGLMLAVITDSNKIRQSEWFKQFNNDVEKAKEDLLDNFSAQPIANARLIAVEMKYRSARDARTILEEIVREYILEQQKRASDAWRDQAQSLVEQRATLDRDYKKIRDKLTEKTAKAGAEDLIQLYSLQQSRMYEMNRLTEMRMTAQQDFDTAKNEHGVMEAMLNNGETPPEIEAEIFKQGSLNSYQERLDDVELKIASLGGSNSPQAEGLMRLRQKLELRLEDEREKLRNAFLAAKSYTVKTELENAQKNVETADQRLAGVEAELRDIQAATGTYKMLEDDLGTVKKKIDQVSDQLDKIEQRKIPSNWSPVVWFSQPPTPDTPTFPKLGYTMTAAVMLGLALSIGIAFLREITDTSIRSPRDIARVGQMNLLGMIPHEADDPQAAGARIPLVIFDAPNSMAAEEFRKLRTRLQHTSALDSTRSILVSSANPGDGKTTIACNLAAGLALNGRRILLVDANFRRPDIHNLFVVPNERGLSDALNDLSTFDTLVRDTPVQNLYVMPTGPKPVNATELLESQLLIDFIERALEDYDHVIFDSGPLLIVSETMALAPRVDGVITVVRARTNSRGVLQRMRDGLRQVKAEHLGVVLNAVRSQGGGYYGRNIKTYYAYQNGA